MAADIIVQSTLIIPSFPRLELFNSTNCLQCDCLSKVLEGIEISRDRNRIRVKERERETRRRERGAEILAKSCQDDDVAA